MSRWLCEINTIPPNTINTQIKSEEMEGRGERRREGRDRREKGERKCILLYNLMKLTFEGI
jgi:hypothetical protein